MNRKTLTLTLSVLVIVICLSLISMGTYALFSDTVSIEHHLQAGNLNVQLERTYLESKVLGSDGYFDTVTNDQTINFTSSTTKNANIFDLTSSTLVAPGSSYEATLKLTNKGSVAFGYWVEIDFKDSVASDLAKQMKLYVTTYDEDGNEVVTSVYLENGLSVGSDSACISSIAVGGSAVFKVKIVFEDLSINNDAQNDEAKFDLIVNAVQDLEK